MIRLIATDLDGTLLEDDGTLPEGIFEAVEGLSRLGICFAACSGRQYGNLRRLFGRVANQMAFVCENGAVSYIDGEIAGVIPIPEEDAQEAIRDIRQAGMNLLISGRHTCYMLDENRRYTDDIVYRLRNTITIVEDLSQITEPMLKVSGQIDTGLEAIAPANKGMGMRLLMQKMNVSKEEAAAFGDNFNDETMLDSVGYPFLMSSADPALRKSGYMLCEKELPVLKRIIEGRGTLLTE